MLMTVIIETRHPTLMFGDQFGLEARQAITRDG